MCRFVVLLLIGLHLQPLEARRIKTKRDQNKTVAINAEGSNYPKLLSFATSQLARLEQEVDSDASCASLSSSLLKYAADSVNRNIATIRNNLATKGIRTLDILWPGYGYNNVADGGSFEVLGLLQKMGLLKIGKIMGASGGAASAILSVADGATSSATLLKYYMVYAKWAAQTSDPQIIRQTPLWDAIYRRVVEDSDAFERVKARAWAAMACSPVWTNSVLYNYKTRAQVGQAFYASGDLSLQGVTGGTHIDDMFWRLHGTCADGGGVTYFPESHASLMHYKTNFEFLMKCDMNSIETLFKRGVDETVELLMSSALKTENMRAGVPRHGNAFSSADYKELGLGSRCTYFYDVSGSGYESQSCFR